MNSFRCTSQLSPQLSAEVQAAYRVSKDFLDLRDREMLRKGIKVADTTTQTHKIIHSLGELLRGRTYLTSLGNSLVRTSDDELLLGSSIRIPVYSSPAPQFSTSSLSHITQSLGSGKLHDNGAISFAAKLMDAGCVDSCSGTDTTRSTSKVHDPSCEEEICALCLDAFDDKNPGTQTDCKHTFHLQCIMEWQERSALCPFCRSSLIPTCPVCSTPFPVGTSEFAMSLHVERCLSRL
eukprot:GILK01010307.1.p1 GENE.GILK01010307.1~~GILK01010307.1.p1  ORF type:complete len:236 (+),score=15.78 GILK01010307.1:182-889(+)